VPAEPDVRQIRARERNRAGCPQVRDRGRVERRNHAGERGDTLGRRGAGVVDVFLDRERHSVEGTDRFTPRDRGVGGVGSCQRLVVQRHRDRVDRGIDGFDARKMRLDDLATRDRAVADGCA
jgi:hypothetical protein